MKKTILVVYTTKKKAEKDDKRYCFTTESEVAKGEILVSKAYTTPMLVVEVIDKEFKYYNSTTGEMSNELTSTQQREIKNLKVVTEADTDVICVKFNPF